MWQVMMWNERFFSNFVFLTTEKRHVLPAQSARSSRALRRDPFNGIIISVRFVLFEEIDFFFFFLHDRALRLEIHVLFTWPCCEPLRGWSRGNILSASLFEDGSRKGMWEFSFCRPARGWLCEIFYRNSRSVVWEFADYHVKILDNVKMIEKNSKMARKKSSARVSLSRFNPSIFVGIRLFL